MILQFGCGNFLRAFVEPLVDELETKVGPVVAVQSTGRERAEAINRAGGKYHLAIQGYENGKVINAIREVKSLQKALHAGSQWGQVLETACQTDLVVIISNTTEAGIALDDRDRHRPVHHEHHDLEGRAGLDRGTEIRPARASTCAVSAVSGEEPD